MYINNPKRFIVILLAALLISFISIKTFANKQDQQFAEKHETYNAALSEYENGQYETALQHLLTIYPEHKTNEKVNLLASYITYSTENYKEAAKYGQIVLDVNPHKVEDAKFMLHLGSAYFYSADYDKARVILLHCQNENFAVENMPEYQQTVSYYIEQLPSE